MSNNININIKELRVNLSKINKSGKLLLNDLEELYNIVEYIKLYKKRGFKINNILSLVNNNIHNTEQYLINIIEEIKNMSNTILNKTIIINNNNNITNSNETDFTEFIMKTSNNPETSNKLETIIYTNSTISTTTLSSGENSATSDISITQSPQNKEKNKETICCNCFKL